MSVCVAGVGERGFICCVKRWKQEKTLDGREGKIMPKLTQILRETSDPVLGFPVCRD